MASSSSVVEEATPPWEKFTPELTSAILQRLGAEEILMTAVKVCPTWWRLSLDPSMWRYIIMEKKPFGIPSSDLVDICRLAVDLSCGQLIGIRIKGFGSDDLLHYISQRSGQLKHLVLVNCDDITGEGVKEAIKNLPLLEDLRLHYTYIDAEAVEAIGRSCPLLKSFILTSSDWRHVESDDEALAIAENMHDLHHLRLLGNRMTNLGFKAIVEACPHLETLYMRRCHNVDLGKLCSQRIKDIKLRREDYYYEDDIGGVSDLAGYDDGYFDD